MTRAYQGAEEYGESKPLIAEKKGEPSRTSRRQQQFVVAVIVAGCLLSCGVFAVWWHGRTDSGSNRLGGMKDEQMVTQMAEARDEAVARFGIARFGDNGPILRACPWYQFDASGEPVLPRGRSAVGVGCRSSSLAKSMDAFRAGEDFFIPRGGTALGAFVGGKHDMANDMDLDATLVHVRQGSALLETHANTGLHEHGTVTSNVAPSAVTTALIVTENVKYHMDPEDCMKPGGYGEKTITPGGHETATGVSFIEDKLCLCEAEGVKTICYKDVKTQISGRYGFTYWMPLPQSKNLGYPLWTYVGLGEQFSGWRRDTLADLKSWDSDGDGRISLAEMLQLAIEKGVSAQWLEAVKKEDPCAIINGRVSADLWLRVLEDVHTNREQFLKDMEQAGLKPGDMNGSSHEEHLDGKPMMFIKKKYHTDFLDSASACGEQLAAASSTKRGNLPAPSVP